MAAAPNAALTEPILSPSIAAPPPIIREFDQGIDGLQPAAEVVAMAAEIVQAALDHTIGPHITFNDADSLDFHLRLSDGLLVMANLFADGTIDASVYNDSQGMPAQTVGRMRRATTSAADLVHLFQAGIHARAT